MLPKALTRISRNGALLPRWSPDSFGSHQSSGASPSQRRNPGHTHSGVGIRAQPAAVRQPSSDSHALDQALAFLMLEGVCAKCRRSVQGGLQVRSRRSCNRACYDQDEAGKAADAFSPLQAREFGTRLRSEACPRCHKSEHPLSAWTAYRIFSSPILTIRTAESRLCCTRCGIVHVALSAIASLLFGWWGRGMFHTPGMLYNAITSARRQLRGPHPTPELCEQARYVLAERGVKPAARLNG